jgi:hypothetical protein
LLTLPPLLSMPPFFRDLPYAPHYADSPPPAAAAAFATPPFRRHAADAAHAFRHAADAAYAAAAADAATPRHADATLAAYASFRHYIFDARF